MTSAQIEICILGPDSPELVTCARWRVSQFSVLDRNVETEIQSLKAFASDQDRQVALVARQDGVPIGTCLLAPSEINPNHHVSPWLAGLYVAPSYRRRGAGGVLVKAVEMQARFRAFSQVFLYTSAAVGFYERLGWSVSDRTIWNGVETALMVRSV